MQTEADTGIGPVSCKNCSVFKKGEGGPEAPGALRLRNKKATASVASSYSQNTPVYALSEGSCYAEIRPNRRLARSSTASISLSYYLS